MPKFITPAGFLFKVEYVDAEEHDYYDKKRWETRYVIAKDMEDASNIVTDLVSRTSTSFVMRVEEITSDVPINKDCFKNLHGYDYLKGGNQ